MKSFRFFTKSLISVLILSALAFAQTEKTQTSAVNKIATINTEAFYDKETGIKEVIETNDKLEAEFKLQSDELFALAEKILKLQKELEEFQKLSERFKGICVPDDINKKFDDYEKLTSEYKEKQRTLKSLYDKRKPEIFAGVYKRVGDAIKQFAKEKGLLIIDISKDFCMCICEFQNDDVTAEFIKYYNENFAKTKTQ